MQNDGELNKMGKLFSLKRPEMRISIFHRPIRILVISLLVSSCACSDVYKALCTPTIFQARELIRHAFDRNVEPQNVSPEFRSWTSTIELRSFCRSNGLENDALPERIKVSKIPKMSSTNRDQVDILLTVKVPISRFYVDKSRQAGYRYWLMYKWPFEPFFCPLCRTFLTYSAEKNSSLPNQFDFLYGMMQNRFPIIVNPETLETIRRENKKEFFTQQFNFQGSKANESNAVGRSLNGNNEPTEDRLNGKENILEANTSDVMSTLTTSPGTTLRAALSAALNSTQSTTPSTAQNTILSTKLSATSSSTRSSGTNATANRTDLRVEKMKKTIYVNLSSFAPLDKYFLVGMNMLDSDEVFVSNRTGNGHNNRTEIEGRRRSKREVPSDSLSMRAGQFYLEYSLCYHVVANFYQPSVNCYPLFVDDQLRHASAESLAIADCICWRPHAYKCELSFDHACCRFRT